MSFVFNFVVAFCFGMLAMMLLILLSGLDLIKANGTNKDGRPVIVVGLSEENIGQLLSRQPVVIEGRELGTSYDLTLLYGKTDEELIELFQLKKAE